MAIAPETLAEADRAKIDEALGLIRKANRLVKQAVRNENIRESALTSTKLDEAEMWARKARQAIP